MINFFLAALGLDYLQKSAPQCQHVELYLDGRTVRCKGCKDYWPCTKPGPIPSNWEEIIRRDLAHEANQ